MKRLIGFLVVVSDTADGVLWMEAYKTEDAASLCMNEIVKDEFDTSIEDVKIRNFNGDTSSKVVEYELPGGENFVTLYRMEEGKLFF